MLALSPPLFSTFGGWPSGDPSLDHMPPLSIREVESFNGSTQTTTLCTGDPKVVKKLNHNASERDRRKKIGDLYSSLRSLLPDEDQSTKLSIPNTVSRVLKYIPEQQQQVKGLIQRKKELLSRITEQGNGTVYEEKQRKGGILTSVSASTLGDREIVVQISTLKVHESASISEVMMNLEVDGFHLISASSFESCGGRVFYNLHLQVQGTQRMECGMLSEKILSLYEKNVVNFN